MELFKPLITDVVLIIATLIAALAAEFLRRYVGIAKIRRIQEELAAKQELAVLAVRFVEQVYRDLGGPEKYNKAAEWLAARAQEHGISFSSEEIQGLIEAALRQLKDTFGNEWARQVQ